MTEYGSEKRDPSRCPSHPGALLREVVIPATGMSKAEIAGLLRISRQHLHDILAEEEAGLTPCRGPPREAFW